MSRPDFTYVSDPGLRKPQCRIFQKSRHEYFRRIACELIGGWVENGEYPDDEKSLQKIIEGIAYKNAKRYFEI